MDGEAKRKPGCRKRQRREAESLPQGTGHGAARSLNRGKHSKPGTMGSARQKLLEVSSSSRLETI